MLALVSLAANDMMRSLEADGLVTRTVYPEVPPRMEYSLTPRGHGLTPHLDALVGWAAGNAGEIIASREGAEVAT